MMQSSRDESSNTSPFGTRAEVWANLEQPWDLIIVGGGITGAGILALAARMGLRALLLEQSDFASGTSSRSSKLVHGGIRYLKQMQLRLTRESVHERQYLLHAAPGLVTPLNFIYPIYEGDSPGAWMIELGLGVYTHLSRGAGGYQELAPVDLLMLAPGLSQRGLERGYLYGDAQTDDARLVLRVLQDALRAGQGRAAALNYAQVTGLLRAGGRVAGVAVRDGESGATVEVRASLVINATGAWANRLRTQPGDHPLRPLRGSHLFFSARRFPVYQAVSMLHPDDNRPVYALPWQGVTLVGTTDIDHTLSLDREPTISAAEVDYLLKAVHRYFPSLELGWEDILTTQAGVRPVVDTGKEDPSKEARDHILLPEEGLLTVTGGKLTTFRLIAQDVLHAAHDMQPDLPRPDSDLPVLDPTLVTTPLPPLDRHTAARLWGRYGHAAPTIIAHWPHLLTPVPGAPYLWAELAWSAEHEAIRHLDDLLLRRFRLGILLPDGGQSLLPTLKPLVQPALAWTDARWTEEVERYGQVWRTAHGVPEKCNELMSNGVRT